MKYKLFSYIIIFIVGIFVILVPKEIYAGGNEYTYTKESILNSRVRKNITNVNSVDYLFEFGIELIRAGLYDEAISKFMELRFKFQTGLLHQMSYIYEGIALLQKNGELRNLSTVIVLDAYDIYKHIINKYKNFTISPSEDLTYFYALLSKQLRHLLIPDFSLKGYLEYSLTFFNSNNAVLLEIGYLNFLQGNFYSAINIFKNSNTYESQLGLAKSYASLGFIKKSIEVCNNLLSTSAVNLSSSERLTINKYLSVISSLNPSTTKITSETPFYLYNSDGTFIPYDYRIYVGSYSDKATALNVVDEASTLLGINFRLIELENVYIVSSRDLYRYGSAKTNMEYLILNNYNNAFIYSLD